MRYRVVSYPHLNGYLITTSDGHETAIGSHCGKTHFGMSFTRERQRVDQAIARRRRIESVMAMIEDMPRMIATIEVLESDYRELQEKGPPNGRDRDWDFCRSETAS